MRSGAHASYLAGLPSIRRVPDAAYSQAAQREHVSQPSLSQQIHKLEEELNQQLFDRLPRSVVLTEAGRCLLPCADIRQVSRCDLHILGGPDGSDTNGADTNPQFNWLECLKHSSRCDVQAVVPVVAVADQVGTKSEKQGRKGT